jgi:PKD repeat protein
MKLKLFIFFFLSVRGVLYSQFYCITPEINKRAEKLNPDAIRAKMELEEFTKQFSKKKYYSKNTYVIPVVFHVVHNYGPENISKAQILDAIRILNEDFNKRNADTANIIPEFKSIAADCHIEFRLAKIDPNGNCTDGIDRVVSTLTYNANENTKLVAPSWDRTKYLNIWVVASIESGAAGYAYYPSSVDGPWGVPYDGIMILSSYVGSIGTGSYTKARALTHEVGHYLNLMHTWGNSNNPGLADNCNDDDQVNDTPNTVGHTNCDLYAQTCGTLDNVQNYMEYSYCYCMFTEGQKIRMHAALNSNISGRNNLWSLNNLIQTGVHESLNPQICIPIADFITDKKFICVDKYIQYKNLTWNTDTVTNYIWNFPGGNPSTSNQFEPIVLYSQAGIYSASLTAQNPAGSNTIVKQNVVQVLDSIYAYSLPLFESFEYSQFPQTQFPNVYWYLDGTGSNSWYRTTIASYSGSACIVAPNNLNENESQIELYSPNILLQGQNASNIVKFKLAYAQKDENSNDKLQVYVSYNCGETWYPRLSKSGYNLQTVNGQYINNFVPSINQWREEYFYITLFLNKPFIRIKFVATSNGGNPIYIDDIQLDKATSAELNDFDKNYMPIIFPNPTYDKTYLWIYTLKEEPLTINIFDVTGRLIEQNNLITNKGENNIELPFATNLSKGVYFINIKINNQSKVLKFIVQ